VPKILQILKMPKVEEEVFSQQSSVGKKVGFLLPIVDCGLRIIAKWLDG
jgi:hypothetical protein